MKVRTPFSLFACFDIICFQSISFATSKMQRKLNKFLIWLYWCFVLEFHSSSSLIATLRRTATPRRTGENQYCPQFKFNSRETSCLSAEFVPESSYMKENINSKSIAVKEFIATKLSIPIKIEDRNATRILLSLIALGDDWSHNKPKFNYDTIPQEWERVPGCMADARIGLSMMSAQQHTTDLLGINEGGKSVSSTVHLDGTADSRVALGMLALLCEVSACTLINIILMVIMYYI